MENLVNFIKTVENLKRVKRTGWVREGVPDPETVAAHSFGITVLAHLLADQLQADKEKLILMAIAHDFAEAGLGDLVLERGTKTIYSRKNRFKQEKKYLKKLCSTIPNGDKYLNAWIEFEEGKTKEAIIFKQLDKLEMVFQAFEYEKDINPHKLDEFWTNTKLHLKEPLLIKIFNTLEKQRKK